MVLNVLWKSERLKRGAASTATVGIKGSTFEMGSDDQKHARLKDQVLPHWLLPDDPLASRNLSYSSPRPTQVELLVEARNNPTPQGTTLIRAPSILPRLQLTQRN